jgi:hypothetical protein
MEIFLNIIVLKYKFTTFLLLANQFIHFSYEIGPSLLFAFQYKKRVISTLICVNCTQRNVIAT